MRLKFLGTLVICSLCPYTFSAFAEEESCAACDRLVQVIGQFAHFKIDGSNSFQGGVGVDLAAFREEIYGPDFTVAVAHLPAGGDRTKIELPSVQLDLLKALRATGIPVIFVNCSGSAIAMPWAAENLPAIVQAWYPGEQGGRAVADILFGDVNPAGRLPVTFYRSTADLPGFENYSMSNRTYRYFNGKPLFAFGHGLSYTQFSYQQVTLNHASLATNDLVKVSFYIKNVGGREGDDVVQVYVRQVHPGMPQAKLALCGFARLHLAPGQTQAASIDIPVDRFRYWDVAQKHYAVSPGHYELMIGAAADDIRLKARWKSSSHNRAKSPTTH